MRDRGCLLVYTLHRDGRIDVGPARRELPLRHRRKRRIKSYRAWFRRFQRETGAPPW